MICFDPVSTSCSGGPEVISHYFIFLILIDLTHWVSCPSPENPAQMCPVYAYVPGTFDSNGPSPCVPWPDPDLNDIFVFETHPGQPTFPKVVTVDAAGNTSEECF